MYKKEDDNGLILIVLLVVISIVLLVIGTGINILNSSNKKTWATANEVQALYIAEAAIDKTITNPFAIKSILNLEGSKLIIEENIPFPSNNNKIGTYSVSGTRISFDPITNKANILIEATGNVGKNSKTIECIASIITTYFSSPVLDNVLASDQGIDGGKVYISVDPNYSGSKFPNIYSINDISIRGVLPGSVTSSQGTVTINNDAEVYGNVRAERDVTISKATINGSVLSKNGSVNITQNSVVKNNIKSFGYFIDKNGNKISVNINQSDVQDVYAYKKILSDKKSTYKNLFENSLTPPSDENLIQTLPNLSNAIQNWIDQSKINNNILIPPYNLPNELGNTYIEGDLNITSDLKIIDNSIIFVNGSINILNGVSLTGNGFIVSNGNLQINNNSNSTTISLVALNQTTSDPSIIANNSDTLGSIFIPNGELIIKNKSTITGALFAKIITFQTGSGNNSNIIFNPGITNSMPPTSTLSEANFSIQSWKEK